MDAYEAYEKYIALKLHFTTNYDYFKYHGKAPSANKTKFQVRKDKYFFHKISKLKQPEQYLVANFIVNQKFWPGEINNTDSHAVFTAWQKRIQSLSYTFKLDLNKLDSDYDRNIIIESGHPLLLRLVMRKDICIETLIILNELTPFFGYWDKKLDFVWEQTKKTCEKYSPFFLNTVDLKQYKSYIIDHFG